MKRTRHTPEQIVNKLRDADAMLAAGRSIAQIIQQLGVSEQTYHRWRNQYGGMKAEEAKRLRELEVENARLKKLVAEQALDMAVLKEANGPEFIATALSRVASLSGVENLYTEPGAPWENGHAESFHSWLRDELLNAEVFADDREAKSLAAAWTNEYNHRRPHSSLGYVPPAVYAVTCATGRSRGATPASKLGCHADTTLIETGTGNGGRSGRSHQDLMGRSG